MEILYCDKDIVVCLKLVGLDSQQQIPSLIKENVGGEVYAVHRLDLNVGGLMVYARNKTTAANLSRCIQEGKMVKEYVALVHGIPPENEIWKDLLWKDSRKNKVYVVKRVRKGVKKAKLEMKRLTAKEPSLVHIRLYTGRSHQIRVQFASRGYPLVGDHKYGSRDKKTIPMLFSYKISFPFNGELKCFERLPEWTEISKSKLGEVIEWH